jgi:CBS-domain-containing membrane protein
MMNAIDRLRTLRVADVMSRGVIVISSEQSMADVARNFVEHDVIAAPVIDEQGRCVGFFSAADYLRRQLPSKEKSQESAPKAAVSRYMTCHVLWISPGESLLKAARMMCDQHVHRLPVINDEGRVVGIISTMDIVAALINAIDEMNAASFQGMDF